MAETELFTRNSSSEVTTTRKLGKVMEKVVDRARNIYFKFTGDCEYFAAKHAVKHLANQTIPASLRDKLKASRPLPLDRARTFGLSPKDKVSLTALSLAHSLYRINVILRKYDVVPSIIWVPEKLIEEFEKLAFLERLSVKLELIPKGQVDIPDSYFPALVYRTSRKGDHVFYAKSGGGFDKLREAHIKPGDAIMMFVHLSRSATN